MLVLDQVQLRRFKAAFKPKPIPLRPFTVIIGRNGAGKSTLLEALQWLDRALRQDARAACERYNGVHDLINVRSQVKPLYFELELRWNAPPAGGETRYQLRVEEGRDGFTPVVRSESLRVGGVSLLTTLSARRHEAGLRVVYPSTPEYRREFAEPDRLALARGSAGTRDDPFARLQTFWSRAVFLRLSPNRLVAGSRPKRTSFEPLLDEEGQNLPALLLELTTLQRAELVRRIQAVLKDISSVDVKRPRGQREQIIHYSLKERMPFQGQKGRKTFDVPAWMLSEGTRRITALFALLAHEPRPSLLCVEEIENGLDPWTVTHVLAALRSAADQGTQVIVTTHSPWLLDDVAVEDILHVQRDEGETTYTRFAERKDVRAFSVNIPPGARYVNLDA